MQRQSIRMMEDEMPPPEVRKIEGRSSLPRKLEDPEFRKNFIANRPVPPGRDIWTDNDRLDIRLPLDPLEYTWPVGIDYATYDPVLKRSWEDEMFEMKWFGKAGQQVQGGDWANNRISHEVPPRIKIYYANIVERFQGGNLLSATKVFNDLLDDFLAPRGSIPYGVYHTMLLIYKKRGRSERALDMFNEIVSYHTPTPDDYALGMEVLLDLNAPRDALEVWQSFTLRPSLKPNAAMYSMLLRTYARLGDDKSLASTFDAAEAEAKRRVVHAHANSLSSSVSGPLDFLPIYNTMLEIYAGLGYAAEFAKLVEPMTAQYPLATIYTALNGCSTLGLHDQVISKWNAWLSSRASNDIAAYPSILKAHLKKGDINAVDKVLSDIAAKNHTIDVEIYNILISNRFALGENAKLTALVNSGLTLKNVRPSIRNFRSVRAANIIANASSSSGDALGTARNALEELETKRIEVDPEFLAALTKAYTKQDNLKAAIALWRTEVVERNLVPTRAAFTDFFTLTGINFDHINAALAWKLAQENHVVPDRAFASALALALQPNRNHFGRIETRTLHKKWTTIEKDSTGHSLGARVLNKTELEEFTKFIDHVLAHFTESDKIRLAQEWREMYAAFSEPLPEEIAEDVKPSSRPADTTAPVRRIFAKDRPFVPTPGSDHPEEAAAKAAAAFEGVSEVLVQSEAPAGDAAAAADTHANVVAEKTE